MNSASATGTNGNSQSSQADAAARSHSATGRVGGPASCESEKLCLEAVVADEMDAPLADVVVRLAKSEREVVSSVTNREGRAGFRGLDAGEYKLTLPQLDGDAWEVAPDADLTPVVSAESAWRVPPPVPARPNRITVVQGDCVASLAYQYGLLPQTLWDANAALHKERKSHSVLYPDDQLTIPPLSAKQETVKAGSRYTIRRKGLPEMFRIAFEDPSGVRRTQAPYLVTFKTAEGETLASRRGETDDKGYLIEPVPPDVWEARVLLLQDDEQEEHHYRIGYLDPVSTISGVQARLNNLGFFCGEEDGEMSAWLTDILAEFQQHYGLPVTGEICDATRRKLVELHRS